MLRRNDYSNSNHIWNKIETRWIENRVIIRLLEPDTIRNNMCCANSFASYPCNIRQAKRKKKKNIESSLFAKN